MKNIKTIDDYMKLYLEAYDTPLNIDWEKDGSSLVGYFKVKDLEYKIYSDIVINDFMTYKFKYKKDNAYSDELLNSDKNYKISVLPTIKSGLDFILNNVEPSGVIFDALDESKGRKMIYDRYCNQYVDTKKWKVYTQNYDNKKMYIIYKKEISDETLFETIKYCGDNFIDINNF
jgi:hypothetical protein